VSEDSTELPKGLVHVVVEPGSDYSLTVARASIREQGLRDTTSSACALSAFSIVRVNETPNQTGCLVQASTSTQT
jgi:hypothetical protein